MAIKLQVRRGTAAQWATAGVGDTVVLLSGEIGFETDTGNVKVGDGTNVWNSLPYLQATFPQTTVSGTDINAAGYRVQGRYLVGTGVTSNVPSAWTAASDAPAVLHVTALSGNQVSHLLVSTKTQKAFARGYDGSAWTTWVAVSQYAGSITVTELANDAVETAKIKSATGTTDGVTDAKLRHSTALSVIGRSANTNGAPADIAASSDNTVLRRSGTSIGFGTIVNAQVDASAAIAHSKLANTTASGVLGATSASTVTTLTSGSGGTARTALGLGTAAYSATTDFCSVPAVDSTTTDIVGNAQAKTINASSLVIGQVTWFNGSVAANTSLHSITLASTGQRTIVLASAVTGFATAGTIGVTPYPVQGTTNYTIFSQLACGSGTGTTQIALLRVS